MAYPQTTEDTIQWSEETFSLREVVMRVGLPTLVKVSEGIYSDNEAETFSCGDLLKLDFVKSIRKVSAKLLYNGDDDCSDRVASVLEQPLKYDTLKDDILIPIKYKGRVEIVKPNRELYTVDELMEEFPRYIRTETKLVADGKISSTHLSQGVCLEVDRIIPQKGIVCRYKNKDLIIRRSQNAKFSVPTEERTYTLEQVVEYFQFPQFVRFIDTDFASVQTTNLDEAIENIRHFSGILQLTREVIQNVVVGHHKPCGLDSCKTTSTNRSIALLPLDSISEEQIVFSVPIYSDPEEYHLVMTRNFSQDIDMSSLDGVLYLEFAKDPKVHLFHTNEGTPKPFEEPACPLPARKSDEEKAITTSPKSEKVKRTEKKKKKAQSASQKQSREQTTEGDNGDNYDYPDVSDILINGKQKQKKKKPHPESSQTQPLKNSNGTNTSPIYDEADMEELQTRIKDKKRKPQSLPNSAASQSSLRDARDKNNDELTMPKSPENDKKRKTKLLSTASTPEENQVAFQQNIDYDYPDVSTIPLPRPIPKSRSKTSDTTVRNPKSIASVTPSMSDNTNVSVVAVVPQERLTEEHSCPTRSFSLLSVEEVSKCLKACGLSEVAKVCERELLDGAFLNELSSEELERELFSLTPIQMKKLERIKKGWRPKLEKPRK